MLLAYHFQCPNNSLPLIWADGENNAVDGAAGYPWNALFPYRPKTKAAQPSEDEEDDDSAANEREKIRRKIGRLLGKPHLSLLQKALIQCAGKRNRSAQTPRDLLCPPNGAEAIAILKEVFNPALREFLQKMPATRAILNEIKELIGWIVAGMVNHEAFIGGTYTDIAPQPADLRIACKMPDLTLLIVLNHALTIPLMVELTGDDIGYGEIVSENAIKPLAGCSSPEAADEVFRILCGIWRSRMPKIYNPPASLAADEWGRLEGALSNSNYQDDHRFTYFPHGAIADEVLAGVRIKLPSLRIFMVSDGDGRALLLAGTIEIADFLQHNMRALKLYEQRIPAISGY